ncbi:MAG: MFS transporter [Enterocloster sp.]
METRTRRWPILALGTAVMFFTGIIYGWSILKAPLQEEFSWTASQLALNFTLTMCMFCIGGILSGILLSRISLKLLLGAAGIMAGIGFIIASGVGADGLGRLYLSYGILSGLGIGIGYNAIISVVNEWFPDKKGTSSGALMMSFGASALIFGNIANFMISSPIGWRSTFKILGILIGITLLLAAAFMRHPTKEDKIPEKPAGAAGAEPEKHYTPKEMVRRPTFIRFFLFLVLACAVGNSTISMARDVAVSVGAEAGLAALLAGVLSLCNGAGRLLAGMLFDRCGQRVTMTIDGIVTIIAPAVMLLAVSSHSVAICAAGLCLAGLSYSFQPPVTSSVVSSFYGTKHFSINFSIANLMMIPTSFAATIGGVLYTSTGSYFAPFLLLLVFSVISFVLNLSIRHA